MLLSSCRYSFASFEENFNLCVGLLHLNRDFPDVMPGALLEALDSLEKSEKKVMAKFVYKQSVKHMSTVAELVGLVIMEKFRRRDGNFIYAKRLGVMLNKMKFSPFRHVSSTLVRSIEWNSYSVMEILEFLADFDIGQHIAHANILGREEFVMMIRNCLLEKDEKTFTEWRKSLEVIFRHSSYADLVQFQDRLRTVKDEMIPLQELLCVFFRQFPYVSVAQVLLDLVPEMDNLFPTDSMHRRILDLVGNGKFEWKFLEESAKNEGYFLQIALYDYARATSNVSNGIQEKAFDFLLYYFFKRSYTKVAPVWLIPLLPKKLSFDRLVHYLRPISNIFENFPSDAQLIGYGMKLFNASLNDIKDYSDISVAPDFDSRGVVSVFKSVFCQQGLSSSHAKAAIEALGHYFFILPKDEKKKLIFIFFNTYWRFHQPNYFSAIILEGFLLNCNGVEERVIIQQYIVRLLFHTLNLSNIDKHIRDSLIDNSVILLENSDTSFNEDFADAILESKLELSRVHGIGKLLKAIKSVKGLVRILYSLLKNRVLDCKIFSSAKSTLFLLHQVNYKKLLNQVLLKLLERLD